MPAQSMGSHDLPVPVSGGLAHAECPVCACALDANVVKCPRCDTPHHRDCWDFAGGCAIFGCARQEATLPASPEAFEAVRRGIESWVDNTRSQWGSLAALSFSQLILIDVVLLNGSLSFSATSPLYFAVLAAIFMCVLSMGAFGLFLLRGSGARGEVERRMSTRLRKPPKAKSLLPTRIEMTPVERRVTTTGYLLGGFTVFLLVMSVVTGSMNVKLAQLVYDAFVWALVATFLPRIWKSRVDFVTTILNRLQATSKARELGHLP